MRPLLVPALAAVAGIAGLVAVYPRVHPAASWDVPSREGWKQMARRFAGEQRLDVNGWSSGVTLHELDQRRELYLRQNPPETRIREFHPVVATVLLASPDKKRKLIARFRGDGRLFGWESIDTDAGGGPRSAGDAVAEAAFRRLAGIDAERYRRVSRATPEGENLRYRWEWVSPMPDVSVAFVYVEMRGNHVAKAEHGLSYSSEFTTAYDEARNARDPVGAGFVLLSIAGIIAALVVIAAKWVRHRTRFRTALLLAVLFVVQGAIDRFLVEADDLRFRALIGGDAYWQSALNWLLGAVVMGLLSLLVLRAAQGAGGVAARRRWLTLEFLLERLSFTREAGIAAAAGLLLGVFVAAAPVLIAASGLFGSPLWRLQGSASALVSVLPLRGFETLPIDPRLIGLFGLGMPLLARRRFKWPMRALMAVVGVWFLAGQLEPFATTSSALVLNGALAFAAFGFAYWRFDLLAVIAGGLSTALASNAAALLTQDAGALLAWGWGVLVVLAACLAGALVAGARAVPLPEDALGVEQEPLSDRRQLQAEFSVARRAQEEMLPRNPPVLPGYEIAAMCRPARDVGGDLYDFIPLRDGRVALGVADVSGKGVSAALYMTLTKGLITAVAHDVAGAKPLLAEINRHLYKAGHRRVFVTMALGLLDPAERRLEYARAGHNPAIWRSPAQGTTTFLNSRGIGLGLASNTLFEGALESRPVELSAGDSLFFYSDGITESMNSAGEQYGDERLLAAVEQTDGMAADAARDAIVESVAAFAGGVPAHDDMTLVVVRVAPNSNI